MIKLLENAKIIPLNSPYRKNYVKLQEVIKNLVEDLYKSSEYTIADDRFYLPISKGIANNTKELDAKAIALTISQDKDKFNGHLLEVSMLLPTMKEVKRPLAYGDSKTILDFLQNKDSIQVIRKDLLEMNREAL